MVECVANVAAILCLQVACPLASLSLRLRTRKVLAWQDPDLNVACLPKPASDSDRDLARIDLGIRLVRNLFCTTMLILDSIVGVTNKATPIGSHSVSYLIANASKQVTQRQNCMQGILDLLLQPHRIAFI